MPAPILSPLNLSLSFPLPYVIYRIIPANIKISFKVFIIRYFPVNVLNHSIYTVFIRIYINFSPMYYSCFHCFMIVTFLIRYPHLSITKSVCSKSLASTFVKNSFSPSKLYSIVIITFPFRACAPVKNFLKFGFS